MGAQGARCGSGVVRGAFAQALGSWVWAGGRGAQAMEKKSTEPAHLQPCPARERGEGRLLAGARGGVRPWCPLRWLAVWRYFK